MDEASFAEFDRRARAGEALTVVFLGASLTWGANSTDPVERSWRALIGRRLAQRYPTARWRLVDAAIGGTDSRLGLFRLDRDVARHRPDLVFVDFTLNDDAEAADPDHLASYEVIVRRCIADLRAPVAQALLCSKEMVACLDLARFRTRAAHLAIARAYGTAVGDAFALMQERLRAGALDLDRAWDLPTDTCHPGDLGYELYAEAIWRGLEAALAEGRRCAVPERPLHADTYLSATRVPLRSLAPLPRGWSVGAPTRISAWYDSLMSRWLDDEVIARAPAGGPPPAPWRLSVRGSTLLLFGEATPRSGRLRVLIDGAPAPGLDGGILDCASPCGGTIRLAVALASGLAGAGTRQLILEPLADAVEREWRFESLCLSGTGAGIVT